MCWAANKHVHATKKRKSHVCSQNFQLFIDYIENERVCELEIKIFQKPSNAQTTLKHMLYMYALELSTVLKKPSIFATDDACRASSAYK